MSESYPIFQYLTQGDHDFLFNLWLDPPLYMPARFLLLPWLLPLLHVSLTTWALLACQAGKGQSPSATRPSLAFQIEHFTPANGLAASKVISVAQDSTGYL